MPRHRSRFSDLERQYRQSGGTAAAGSPLANYIAFKAGTRKVTRKKTALTAAQRQRYGISLLPFTLDAPATITQDKRYVASITAYSNSGRTNLGLKDADVGYDKQASGGVNAQQEDAFYPALTKPFVRTATTPNQEASQITGIKYNYYTGNSYAIPFGRRSASAAGDSEEERRAALAKAARESAGSEKAISVGFDPEVFRGLKPALADAPGV